LKTAAACQNSNLIVSSPLPRAISSLETLGVKPDLILNELSEAPLPIFNVPAIKLSPSLFQTALAGWKKVADGESGYWGTVRYALSTFKAH